MRKGSAMRNHIHTPSSVLLFLFAAALVLGCATTDDLSTGNAPPNRLKLIPVEIPGLRPGAVAAGFYVFNESREWNVFWSKYHQVPAPKIALEESALVLVFLGPRPHAGYSVEIPGATEYQSEVILDVVEYLPVPGVMYAQVIVHPYDAVLVAKTNKPIRFKTIRKRGRP